MRVAGIALPAPLADAFRACRTHFAAAAAFSFLLNLLFLAPAIYMLQVYDRVLSTGGKMTLFYVTIALGLALLTLSALDAIRQRLLARAGLRLDRILTPQILRRSLGGDRPVLSVQAMRDFDTVRQTISAPTAAALLDAPWAPIFIIVCFLLHFWLGLLALFSTVVLVFLALRNEKLTRVRMEQASRSLAAAYASQQSAAAQGGTVRALGMTGAMVARQLSERSTGLKDMLSAQFVGGRFSAGIKFFRLFVQSAALGLGALLAINGEISPGAIIAASILVGRALQPVESLVGSWANLSNARTALGNLAELFGAPDEAERQRTTLPAPKGNVELEQVAVRAPNAQRAILSGISFKAFPGEILGIVGPSGSGKTTLARVIAGVIRPDAGTIRIDGAQYGDWDGDELARYIGYMPQEPSLFEGTVKDNISRFAGWRGQDAALVDAQVIAAARLSGVHELILRLPEGYDTVLSGSGGGLSAGQAQRVALARALYGDPALLVLDEPNAFLDADGEASLAGALERARARGACVIVVAHRQGILRSADRLLVLDGGKPQLLGPTQDVLARLAAPRQRETAA